MESYKKHKEIEVIKVKKLQKETEMELKVLIKEHEKQKREAGEKLKLLNDMFKQWISNEEGKFEQILAVSQNTRKVVVNIIL